MKKRILAMVLSLTMLWGLTVNAAESVEEVSQNDSKNTVAEESTEISDEMSVEEGDEANEDAVVDDGTIAAGECGSNLTWVLTTDGTLTISGTGEMEFEENAPWYDWKSDIRKVVIGNGVTSIADEAFDSFDCIEDVAIPDSVVTIGLSAFENCYGLTEIKLPDSITDIGTWAFCFCKNLRSVNIPKGLTMLSEHIFYGCENLTEIEIPENITEIRYDAFCTTGLKSVIIPKSVTSIGEVAFGYDWYDGEHKLVEGFMIYGHVGTTAETYANENQIRFVDLDKPETPLKIIPEKTDETYVLGSGKDLVIYCTGEFSEFVSVEMDGVLVDSSNYKVEEGSTVLTFSSAYLDTLSPGRHVVTLNFVSGSISTYITLLNASEANTSNSNGVNGSVNGNNASQNSGKTSNTVRTGDNGNVALWFTLTVAALGCVVSVIIRRKRVA